MVSSAQAPEGFSQARSRGLFTQHNGPVYRADVEGDLRSAILVLDRHCNGMGFLHGGMAAAFSDSALAWAVWWSTRRMSVTLKLTMTYLEAVRAGSWLIASPVVDAVRDDMVHVHALLQLAGEQKPVARADATFRLLRPSRPRQRKTP